MSVLERLRGQMLPDSWVVSGAIYNTVWNVLTGRPAFTGIKDVDVFYFDDGDLSYEAEDRVIRRALASFQSLPVPVEVRNQARVHLWFRDRFGQDYSPLRSSCEAIDRFSSRTHCVGIRLDEKGKLDVYAPFGLDDIFAFRITPNRVLDNSRTHTKKAARALSVWPELMVVPWNDEA